MEEDGLFEVLPKKEVVELKKEYDRLIKFLGGIRDMKSMLKHYSLLILVKSATLLLKLAN